MEMVDSLDELKSSRSVSWQRIFRILRDAGREDCFCSEQDHPEFPVQEEGQSRGTEAQKEDRSLRGRQIAFMIYDYFRVTGAQDTVLDYADLFSATLHVDNIQDFDTRWDEVLLSMSKIPSDEILESLYKLRIRESDQFKTVWELYDMEIHQNISMPNYQKLKTMVKRSTDQKLRLRNFDARHGRIETGVVVKSRKGLIGVEGEVLVTSGEKKASVRQETNAVSGMIVAIVSKNQNTLPPRLPSQPCHEVEVCRGREASEAKVTMGPFFDNRADII